MEKNCAGSQGPQRAALLEEQEEEGRGGREGRSERYNF